MESPSNSLVITDIVFVNAPTLKPLGYSVIKNTYGGFNAQLYEPSLGRQPCTSYLCFTRKKMYDYHGNDLVVEDMYIHFNKDEDPKEGFEIITHTLDGSKSMRHMKLAIKKVPRGIAKSVIRDIGIYRNKDKELIPEEYIVLPKVNHLRIAFFIVPCARTRRAFESAITSLVHARLLSSTSVRRSFRSRLRAFSIRRPRKRVEKVEPITDVKFVAALNNVPQGYTAIKTSEDGNDANLWFKLMGGLPKQRYLCFTKDYQSDDTVLESIYVLGPSDNQSLCMARNYTIIKKTVEGEDPLRWKRFAVKKIARSQAQEAIVDIKIFSVNDTESIPKKYTAVNCSQKAVYNAIEFAHSA